MGLLGGQAKAMVVTSSRKEAVRYKLSFDRYIKEKRYTGIHAMAAFSGEVEFTDKDPGTEDLLGEKFTETSINPNLKGRDMRKAFDTDDYQVMIVANKFQTGFDQPKLCAMYVDKKLGGVECVQTLSRLNRDYPGKKASGTFVLDFFNEPDDVLGSFQPYYQTAELTDVSDPQMVYDLSDKLQAARIFQWPEVEQFCAAFYQKGKSDKALSSICKPAVDRWSKRYELAVDAYKTSLDMMERTRKTGDAVLIANAENSLKECRQEKDALEIFKKDLGTFVRFYEFISQIVPFDDLELEKLSLFARKLRPMLREANIEEDDVDLDNVVLSHYRLSKIRQQDLKLQEDAEDCGLEPSEDAGSAKAKDPKEEFLSQIIDRLNDIFLVDELTETDIVSFVRTVQAKVRQNERAMTQLRNNTREQAMLGDFSGAVMEAIMDSGDAHLNQTMQVLGAPGNMHGFSSVIYDCVMSDTW